MVDDERNADEEASEHLPLTSRVFLILGALARGPRHGYRLLTEIEELSRGRVTIGPASLYEAIHTLSERGLIVECEAPDDVERDDERRNYYRLTDLGDRVLGAEAERLAELVDDFRERGLVDVPRHP